MRGKGGGRAWCPRCAACRSGRPPQTGGEPRSRGGRRRWAPTPGHARGRPGRGSAAAGPGSRRPRRAPRHSAAVPSQQPACAAGNSSLIASMACSSGECSPLRAAVHVPHMLWSGGGWAQAPGAGRVGKWGSHSSVLTRLPLMADQPASASGGRRISEGQLPSEEAPASGSASARLLDTSWRWGTERSCMLPLPSATASTPSLHAKSGKSLEGADRCSAPSPQPCWRRILEAIILTDRARRPQLTPALVPAARLPLAIPNHASVEAYAQRQSGQRIVLCSTHTVSSDLAAPLRGADVDLPDLQHARPRGCLAHDVLFPVLGVHACLHRKEWEVSTACSSSWTMLRRSRGGLPHRNVASTAG